MTSLFKTAKQINQFHFNVRKQIDYIAFWSVTTVGFILAVQSESKNNETAQVQKGSQIQSIQNNSVHKHLVTNKGSWFI